MSVGVCVCAPLFNNMKHNLFLMLGIIVDVNQLKVPVSHVELSVFASSDPSAGDLLVCDSYTGQSDLPHTARYVVSTQWPFLCSTCRLLHACGL